MFEYDRNPNPLRDELLAEPFTLDGDAVSVPAGPGLGVEVNAEVLRRFTVAARTSR